MYKLNLLIFDKLLQWYKASLSLIYAMSYNNKKKPFLIIIETLK